MPPPSPTPGSSIPEVLTQREVEVLRALASGSTNKKAKTVARHVDNIYARIGAANRAETTAFAARHGLLE